MSFKKTVYIYFFLITKIDKIFNPSILAIIENNIKPLTGFPQTFDNWIQGLFKDFQGQQQQLSRIYFKAWPPLPPLLAVHSSHKILYCQMIFTVYKLFTTMLVNTSSNILT